EPPAGTGDAEFELIPDHVVINPDQWNQSQALTLTTFDNGVVNERRIIGVRVLAIATTDPGYAAMVVDPLLITLDDDERGGAFVEPIPIPGPGPLALLSLIIGLILLASVAPMPRQK